MVPRDIHTPAAYLSARTLSFSLTKTQMVRKTARARMSYSSYKSVLFFFHRKKKKRSSCLLFLKRKISSCRRFFSASLFFFPFLAFPPEPFSRSEFTPRTPREEQLPPHLYSFTSHSYKQEHLPTSTVYQQGSKLLSRCLLTKDRSCLGKKGFLLHFHLRQQACMET